MDMDVHHGLPCCLPDVDPDVVAAGCGLGIEPVLRPPDGLPQGTHLPVGEIEEGGDVPFRDYENVTRRDRVTVS